MKLRLNAHAQYEYMDFCESKKCASDKNSPTGHLSSSVRPAMIKGRVNSPH